MLPKRALIRCTVLSCLLVTLVLIVPPASARAVYHGYTRDELDKLRSEGHHDFEILYSLHPIQEHIPTYLHPSDQTRNHHGAVDAIMDFISSRLHTSSLQGLSEPLEGFKTVPYQSAVEPQQPLNTQPETQYLPHFMSRRDQHPTSDDLEDEMARQKGRLKPKWIQI